MIVAVKSGSLSIPCICRIGDERWTRRSFPFSTVYISASSLRMASGCRTRNARAMRLYSFSNKWSS